MTSSSNNYNKHSWDNYVVNIHMDKFSVTASHTIRRNNNNIDLDIVFNILSQLIHTYTCTCSNLLIFQLHKFYTIIMAMKPTLYNTIGGFNGLLLHASNPAFNVYQSISLPTTLTSFMNRNTDSTAVQLKNTNMK